jgi:D-tyrosyl-tRNA(Tyr) deacylase
MKLLVQRVSRASVTVAAEVVSEIGPGLLLFLGVGHEDGEAQAKALAAKAAKLRIFPDEEGRMNRSLLDMGGSALVVSQFTLLADCRKGNRPSFIGAAEPSRAEALYEYFARELEGLGITVGRGCFGAHMDVALVNDGPVTIWLESAA